MYINAISRVQEEILMIVIKLFHYNLMKFFVLFVLVYMHLDNKLHNIISPKKAL